MNPHPDHLSTLNSHRVPSHHQSSAIASLISSRQVGTRTRCHVPQTKTRTSKLPVARRLANTRKLSYQQWLDIRKQGIGSSDAATACGLNPYMSMLELWMIKTGRMQQSIEDESTGYAPLYWGKQLEPLIAEYYSLHTNSKVRRVNAVLQHPDPDKHFMLANLDYAVVGSDEVQILECKSVGEHGARRWRDGISLYVLCQVQQDFIRRLWIMWHVKVMPMADLRWVVKRVWILLRSFIRMNQ